MMKTLYESILSSTNSGKAHFDEITKKKIDEWMNKYNGACKYVINDDLTITLIKTISTETIYLYAEYNELPEYIKFKNCENYNIAIYNAKNIKSFKGLPAQCNEFYIISPALKELPPLKISCIITTHSVCQPGLPSPHGEFHFFPTFVSFQRLKSQGLCFFSFSSILAPLIKLSID